MNNPNLRQAASGPVINRVSGLMIHIDRYAGRFGVGNLSRDAGVSRHAIMRIIREESIPNHYTVKRVVGALGRALGCKLDHDEVFAERGQFPTPYTCDLVGCRGCLPDAATDEFGDLKRTYVGIAAGKWVTIRHPKGIAPKGGTYEA